mgnify:CR=1 FL=1
MFSLHACIYANINTFCLADFRGGGGGGGEEEDEENGSSWSYSLI